MLIPNASEAAVLKWTAASMNFECLCPLPSAGTIRIRFMGLTLVGLSAVHDGTPSGFLF